MLSRDLAGENLQNKVLLDRLFFATARWCFFKQTFNCFNLSRVS